VRKRDPLGFYAALKVSPEASAVEINLSYKFLKDSYRENRKAIDIGKVQAAFKTLSDPSERRKYDNGGKVRLSTAAVRRRKQINAMGILLVALIISSGVLFFLVGPDIRAQLTSFSAGDQIYWRENGKPLGAVVTFEEHHAFPSGVVVPAYQIQPDSGGDLKWYPARDLKRHCKKGY
jgi:curved DNA-binding protein CbpA